MQIAVCAREAELLRQMEGLIRQAQECRPVVFPDGKDLLSCREKFDILFLEIGKENREEIAIAGQLRQEMDALVIFVSGGPEYVFDAFDVQAFHYLLKPIDEAKFQAVLQCALHEKQTLREKEPLLVRAKGSFYRVEKKNIFYVENVARKVVLHTRNGELSYYARMKEVEEELGSYFFRCHRGYLVNLAAVKSYEAGSILLKNGENILMAKQKYNDFAEAYAGYLRGKSIGNGEWV